MRNSLAPFVRAIVLAMLLTSAASAQDAAPDRHFASRACHITFVYPTAWEVVDDTIDRARPCGFALRPADWRKRLVASDSVDVFTIWIRAFPHGVWKQASESGFERRRDGWVVLGRMGATAPAESIATAALRGVRGTAQAGCYREGGAYFGVCDNPTALLGTNSRSVLVIAGPQSEFIFNRVVTTLRFTP